MKPGSSSDAYLVDPVRAAVVGTIVQRWQGRTLDHVARLATRLLDAPVGLLSAVGPDVQHHLGCHGLLALVARRQLPLSYSFCRYVVQSGAAIVIADARDDERTCGSPSVGELGFVAYLGIPLLAGSGHVLGALCVIDHHPREWIGLEQRDLADLADLCSRSLTAVM